MCLHTDWKEPKEAQEDMICYKVVVMKGNKIVSLYQDFPYELGKEYMLDPDELTKFYEGDTKTSIWDRDINTGFHSYTNKNDSKYTLFGTITKVRVLAKCHIPKGSLYYLGQFGGSGNYCSNKIVIVEVYK